MEKFFYLSNEDFDKAQEKMDKEFIKEMKKSGKTLEDYCYVKKDVINVDLMKFKKSMAQFDDFEKAILFIFCSYANTLHTGNDEIQICDDDLARVFKQDVAHVMRKINNTYFCGKYKKNYFNTSLGIGIQTIQTADKETHNRYSVVQGKAMTELIYQLSRWLNGEKEDTSQEHKESLVAPSEEMKKYFEEMEKEHDN